MSLRELTGTQVNTSYNFQGMERRKKAVCADKFLLKILSKKILPVAFHSLCFVRSLDKLIHDFSGGIVELLQRNYDALKKKIWGQ